MKKALLASILMISIPSFAEDTKQSGSAQPVAPAPVPTPKMTTRDAKKTCKEEGKAGADLVQCMKDKKEEK